MPGDDPSRGILKALMSLISAVIVGLGVLAIVTEVHTGSTRRQGIVTLVGEPAVAFGMIMVALGLMPLAVWARTPLQAKVWIGLCLTAFAVLLVRLLSS